MVSSSNKQKRVSPRPPKKVSISNINYYHYSLPYSHQQYYGLPLYMHTLNSRPSYLLPPLPNLLVSKNNSLNIINENDDYDEDIVIRK